VKADVIVIGSGQGGLPLAATLAARGRHVVLFERGAVGGTCVNVGCTPSKAFLAAAHSAGRIKRARALGVRGDASVDFPFVMERVARIVDEFRSGSETRLENAGVELIRAEARFTGERSVSAAGKSYTAPLIAINTGASASVPPIAGLAGTPYLTNENFFTQRTLPKRMLVLGGGYIGLELGQGMLRCGSEVHVFQTGSRVLPREEADASALLQEALVAEGLRLHLNCGVESVSYDGAQFTVTLASGETTQGDRLLVATGRAPNAQSLDPQASGVALDERGFITIDDRFRTSCEGIFAIGDVAGQPAFTHVAWEDHRRLLAIFEGEDRTRHDRPLAYSTFTEPQVARVGCTLDEARAAGINARAATITLDHVGRGIEWGEERGFYRMVIDEGDKIIGATLVGYEAAELVHVFYAHIMAGSTWQVLDRSVHVHPTFAEGLPSLAREFAG
jgi:pyruvate/2-oxoglutarate dehydrogenase complex dihydrolipoamide dehydrogenase (E3) component